MALPVQSDLITALVDSLGADPCNLPKFVVLRGYLGKGPNPGGVAATQKWRVYLDHALTSYYEIDDPADVLHWIDVGSEDQGQRVWVRHGAAIRLVRGRAGEAEIPPLLGGPIAQTWLPATPPAPPGWSPYTPPGYPPPGGGYHPAHGDGGWGGWDPGWEWSQCKVGCASASP